MKIPFNNKITDYILKYIDNSWYSIITLIIIYFPSLINMEIIKYSIENNNSMAWNIMFYLANNLADNKLSFEKNFNKDGKDPLRSIDIKSYITTS